MKHNKNKKFDRKKFIRSIRRNIWLYIMFAPVLAYYIIFKYLPMYGVQIAFKNYSIYSTITDAPWIGLKNFGKLLSSIYFWRLLRNTLAISTFGLVIGFPAPIILALLLNEVVHEKFKRVIQTISYLPHFVSTVVVVSMVVSFLDPQSGLSKDSL